MFRHAPAGMVRMTALMMVGLVILIVASITDSGEHRGSFIGLSVILGSMTLGAGLLTRAVSRRLRGTKTEC